MLTSTEMIRKNEYFAPALSANLMSQHCAIDFTKANEPQAPMRPSLVSACVQTVQSYTDAETFPQSAHAPYPVFQSGVTVSFEGVA